MDVLQHIKMYEKIYSGAKIFIESLLDEQVEYIFGYPGGAILPIYDYLYEYSMLIQHILTRHEQGSIHAAQGYTRSSGKVGVCIATSGPGATNLVTGLADAFMDNTPIVCITGQVDSNLLRTDSFQEVDIIDISSTITKWNVQINTVKDIYKNIRKAFYISKIGRPGPVLVDITKNAQLEKSYFKKNIYYKIEYLFKYEVLNKIDEAVSLIYISKRPLVIIGQGVLLASAEYEVKNFIEKSGIPVASTLLGLDILNSYHPLFIGLLGMHGNYAPNILTNHCDVIIAIGMRFDDRVTGDIKRYAKKAKIIHFEIDPYEIGKNIYCDIPIIGNCKITIPKFTKIIIKKQYIKWVNNFYLLNEKKIIQRCEINYKNKQSIYLIEIIKFLNIYKEKKSLLVTDVGQHQMIASKYFSFAYIKSNITSGGLGTMGFSLPASIGAKLGALNRQVICIVGDGGLQMTLQELGTLYENKQKIKIVIINNNFLGMVRQWQEFFFEKRYSNTKLINPNFIKIAEAYNIKGERLHKRYLISKSIKNMLTYKGSNILEVIVEKYDNVFPMILSSYTSDQIRIM
jgi:acetolactate synthase-1/2/3 large subunit